MNENTRPVVPQINKIMRVWEDNNWPILCSRFVNLPGSNWERLRGWSELQREPDTLLAKDLKVSTEYIFKKATYSAFSSEVIALCANHRVRDIVIAGVDTNECVLATALAVFDHGFTPWVVEDCCASTGGAKAHQQAIGLLKPLLGAQQVISSQELL